MSSLILETLAPISLGLTPSFTFKKATLSAKDFVLQYPFGVYTVMRTVHKTRILNYSMHLDRLCDGVNKSDVFAKFRSSFTDELKMARKLEEYVNFLRISIKQMVAAGLKEFLKERQNAALNEQEFKISVIVYDRDDHQSSNGLFVGVQVDLLHIVPYDKGIQVELQGIPRKEASVKNSSWIKEREVYTKKHDVTHEILLSSGNDVYEGFTSNVFVINHEGIYETAPIELVLFGTMQKLVLDICDENNFKVSFTCPNSKKISQWKAAFLTSTSRTLVPIDALFLQGGEKIFLNSSTNEQLQNLRELVIKKLIESSEVALSGYLALILGTSIILLVLFGSQLRPNTDSVLDQLSQVSSEKESLKEENIKLLERLRILKEKLINDSDFRYNQINLLSKFSVEKFKTSNNSILTCGSDSYLKSYERQVFVNLCYALSHGYAFIHDKADSDLSGMPANYHKLVAIERAFGFTNLESATFENALWLDMDTIITRFDYDLFEIISSKTEADFVIADHSITLNNGVILMRKSEWLKKFMKSWWECSRKHLDFFFTDNGSLYSTLLRYWFQDGIFHTSPYNFCDQNGVRNDPTNICRCIIKQLNENGFGYNKKENLGRVSILNQKEYRINQWYFRDPSDDQIQQPMVFSETDMLKTNIGKRIYSHWVEEDYFKIGDVIVHTKNPERFTSDEILRFVIESIDEVTWLEFIKYSEF